MHRERAVTHGAFKFAGASRRQSLLIILVVEEAEETSQDVALMRFFLLGHGGIGIHIFPRLGSVALINSVVTAFAINSVMKFFFSFWIPLVRLCMSYDRETSSAYLRAFLFESLALLGIHRPVSGNKVLNLQ